MPEPENPKVEDLSDCFLRYRISDATQNFTSGKSHWRRAATARRGFKMVSFTEQSEDLCRRLCALPSALLVTTKKDREYNINERKRLH